MKTNTGRLGINIFRSSVASSPFITGILASRTTRSGWHSSAFCTASRPFCASAHISISRSGSNVVRTCRRISSLSSAIRTRRGTLGFHVPAGANGLSRFSRRKDSAGYSVQCVVLKVIWCTGLHQGMPSARKLSLGNPRERRCPTGEYLASGRELPSPFCAEATARYACLSTVCLTR